MNKLKIFTTALTAALLLTGCGVAAEQEASYRQINMEEAAEMMEKESGYIILDVCQEGLATRAQGNAPSVRVVAIKNVKSLFSAFRQGISANTCYLLKIRNSTVHGYSILLNTLSVTKAFSFIAFSSAVWA